MTVTHTCGGSEGCMCMYDPDLNTELKVGRQMVFLEDVVDAVRNEGPGQIRTTSKEQASLDMAEFLQRRFKA